MMMVPIPILYKTHSRGRRTAWWPSLVDLWIRPNYIHAVFDGKTRAGWKVGQTILFMYLFYYIT